MEFWVWCGRGPGRGTRQGLSPPAMSVQGLGLAGLTFSLSVGGARKDFPLGETRAIILPDSRFKAAPPDLGGSVL